MKTFLSRIFPSLGYAPTRRNLQTRGLVYILILLLLVGSAIWIAQGKLVKQTKVAAQVNDAGGSLVPGADVKARGVIVGRVTSLHRDGNAVRINFNLTPRQAKKIPTNALVRVLPATVFGTSYLDIQMPNVADASNHLVDGSVLAQDTSKQTLELQQDLDGIDRILKAIHPAELASTLGALADAVDGKGDQLGRMIDRLDAYLGKLTGQLPLIREDLSMLASNIKNFQQTAPELLDAIDAGLTTARTLVNKQNEFAAFLTGGGQIIGDTKAMLDENQQKLVNFLQTYSVPSSALFDSRGQVAPVLTSLGAFARAANTALLDGGWINADAYLVTSPRAFYTSADCPRYGSLAGRNC